MACSMARSLPSLPPTASSTSSYMAQSGIAPRVKPVASRGANCIGRAHTPHDVPGSFMSSPADGSADGIVGPLTHADVVLVLVPVSMVVGVAVLGAVTSLALAFLAASLGTAAAVGHALFATPPTDGTGGDHPATEDGTSAD